MRKRRYPDQIRFLVRVIPMPVSKCWEWSSSKDSDGYGQHICYVDGKKKSARAHRVAWELFNGPIGAGLCVLHICDNPSCVNPDHLFTGTHKDNARDREKKGRGAIQRGEKNGRAIINMEIARAIRNEYLNTWISQSDIAKKYKISQQAVSRIVLGETWADPPAASLEPIQ